MNKVVLPGGKDGGRVGSAGGISVIEGTDGSGSCTPEAIQVNSAKQTFTVGFTVGLAERKIRCTT